ncbi:hypothetical protein ACWFMI_09560 [Nocardiopsis terrae]
MSEDRTKVTLDYLRTLRTGEVEPLREKVSAMKTRASQHYEGDGTASGVNVPFGNSSLMSAAGEVSKEVATVLTQFTTMITDLEERLVGMSVGIRDSETHFDELESDAELDAARVNQIVSGGAPQGSGGFNGTGDPTEETSESS